MKTDIHPKYEKTKIVCACGNEFETRSTASPEMKVELCSVCHPFYTGKQKFVDTAGRVDKFQARMKKAEEVKRAAKPKKEDNKRSDTKPARTSQGGSNKDALKEIKKEINQPAGTENRSGGAPGQVTQKASSDVDAAAESELKPKTDN